MKQTEILALGVAAVAVYLVAKAKNVKVWQGAPLTSMKPKTTPSTYDKVTEILNSDGTRYDNGWRYFSDGTSIDPLGNYFSGNQLIWENPTPTNSLVIPNIQRAGYTY